MTTNYDQLIELAYSNFHILRGRIYIPPWYTHDKPSAFANALWKGDFFILKAHGSANDPQNIILKEKDYRNIIFASPGYRAMMAAIFTTKTLLFLGASMNDPEIQLLFRSLHDAFEGTGVRHYALISNREFNDMEAGHWLRNYGAQCIRYDSSPGHPEVVGFLESIKSQIGTTP